MNKIPVCKIYKIVPYLFCLLAAIFFLLLADESRTPITINAADMERSEGYQDNTAIGLTADSGYSGVMLTSADYLLNDGSYTLAVAYQTNGTDNSLLVYDNGALLGSYALSPDDTYGEYSFELQHSSPEFHFEIEYGGESSLLVYNVTLIPDGRFYYDTFLLIVLLVFAAAGLALWKYHCAKAGKSIQEQYVFFTLCGIGLFASLPYMYSGLNWAIDLCYHLIRVEGIKDGLLAGQFPVVIYPEALKGNGYLNCMYPNLFLYIPALLRLCRISMADSFKFLIFLFNFATAFITYHCAKEIGAERRAALLSALLYSLSPYRFTNIYARGAVGEFLAMTFFPLIFAGLYHICIGDRKKWSYLVLGMTGLLQTHILSVTLAGVFCFLFAVLYMKELFCEKRIIELCKAAVVSLFLNLGFLIPFLDFYKNGDLWMDALSLGTYAEYSLNLSGLFSMQLTGDYHSLTLGLPLCICAVIACAYFLLERKKEATDTFILQLFILGVVLIFMLLTFFPAWKMMQLPMLELLLSKIQFAWRLLGPISLLFALTGSICLMRSKALHAYAKPLLIMLSLLCMLSATRFRDEDFAYAQDTAYTIGHESKLIGIPKGENTVVYPYEWRPRHTTDPGLLTEPLVFDREQVSLKESSREGTVTRLTYTALSDGQYIEIPVLYYMGYTAEDEAHNPVAISKGYNSCIRLSLTGDRKPHTVTVSYRMPLAYTVSAWISILTAVLSLAGWIWSRKNKNTDHIGENKDVR